MRCGQGRCGWEFWEVRGLNEVTTPPPSSTHPSPVPLALEIRCSRVYLHSDIHTGTCKYAEKHTWKTNTILRGIPDLCLHLQSYYSPFCCERNSSLPSDLLLASSGYTVHTNLLLILALFSLHFSCSQGLRSPVFIPAFRCFLYLILS